MPPQAAPRHRWVGSHGAARSPPAAHGQAGTGRSAGSRDTPDRAGGSNPCAESLGINDSRSRRRKRDRQERQAGQLPPSAAKHRELIWGFPRLRVPDLPSCLPSPARSCCFDMSHRWKTNSI